MTLRPSDLALLDSDSWWTFKFPYRFHRVHTLFVATLHRSVNARDFDLTGGFCTRVARVNDLYYYSESAEKPKLNGDTESLHGMYDYLVRCTCASNAFRVLAISLASSFSPGKASLYWLDRTLLCRFPSAY
jgi:hypothetical protein